MDGTIQSVVTIQDPTRTHRPTVVQVVSSSVHPKRGRDAAYAIPLTIDLCQSRLLFLERGCSRKLTQLETGDEQHHGNFETDLGNIPTRFLVD